MVCRPRSFLGPGGSFPPCLDAEVASRPSNQTHSPSRCHLAAAVGLVRSPRPLGLEDERAARITGGTTPLLRPRFALHPSQMTEREQAGGHVRLRLSRLNPRSNLVRLHQIRCHGRRRIRGGLVPPRRRSRQSAPCRADGVRGDLRSHEGRCILINLDAEALQSL